MPDLIRHPEHDDFEPTRLSIWSTSRFARKAKAGRVVKALEASHVSDARMLWFYAFGALPFLMLGVICLAMVGKVREGRYRKQLVGEPPLDAPRPAPPSQWSWRRFRLSSLSPPPPAKSAG
jgi:hypothetical protein